MSSSADYIIDLNEQESSLISSIWYNEELREVTIFFRKGWPADKQVWMGMSPSLFEEFSQTKSFGKFYLSIIKQFLKLKKSEMSEQQKPKGVNNASDKKRYIKMKIDVNKLNKAWFFIGKNGAVYADITLQLLPDGTVDQFENLGMVTQDVPKAVFEKESKMKVPKEKRTVGPILGNGRENEWNNSSAPTPGVEVGEMAGEREAGEGEADPMDDLPF